MADPVITLRALADACDKCHQFAKLTDDDVECISAQRITLMRALPDVEGWPATADELRTMADTVDRLTRERDEARALLTAAVPGLERDALRHGDGDVLTRVRAWLGVCDG